MKKIFNWITKDHQLYFILIGFLLLDRFLLLTNFNFQYTGNDDMIFWLSAADYMKGIFHEPYFYGQNYNFMLESVLAIPLLALGIPPNYAFPLSSSILSLFPFIVFSYILFKQGFRIEGMCFVLIPLLLPVEYGMLTSITRGFTSGLFLSGFMAIALINPIKIKSQLIAALCFSLGYILNPNSVVISLPILLYIFLINYRQISFYLINLIGIVPILLIEYFAKDFYRKNPDYLVHQAWKLVFDYKLVIKNMYRLDRFFNYLMPIIWPLGWLIVIIILLVGIYLLKDNWKKGICLIAVILLIIFSLGLNKVNDNLNTIFLSSTRMFLGIPLLAGLAFFWSRSKIKTSDLNLKYIMAMMAFTVFFFKLGVYPAIIERHVRIRNYGSVAVKQMDSLACECSSLNNIAKNENIDLMIFVTTGKLNTPDIEFYSYGCPILEKNFPKTILNKFERRTWVYWKEKSSIEKNILIYNFSPDSAQMRVLKNSKIISNNTSMVLIKENNMQVDSLLWLLKIEFYRN
jgi:hypothetical protein